LAVGTFVSIAVDDVTGPAPLQAPEPDEEPLEPPTPAKDAPEKQAKAADPAPAPTPAPTPDDYSPSARPDEKRQAFARKQIGAEPSDDLLRPRAFPKDQPVFLTERSSAGPQPNKIAPRIQKSAPR